MSEWDFPPPKAVFGDSPERPPDVKTDDVEPRERCQEEKLDPVTWNKYNTS